MWWYKNSKRAEFLNPKWDAGFYNKSRDNVVQIGISGKSNVEVLLT